MTTTIALTARAVSKTFGSFTAVDDMHIDVAPGEIVGLLGANGAGKTTLIKMLLGLPTLRRARSACSENPSDADNGDGSATSPRTSDSTPTSPQRRTYSSVPPSSVSAPLTPTSATSTNR